MRIACLQFAPQVGDVDNNLNRADAVLSKANPEDIDLLVLPELAFTGYNFKSLQQISPFLEPSGSGITSLWARTTALKYNCVVTVGYPEKVDVSPKWPTGPEYYNSAIVVNGDGETIANYRKCFLYYTDETWALEGKSGFYDGYIPGLGHTSLGICMDINPYKFEAPWHAFEFAFHVLEMHSNLVIVSMAWMTREDGRRFSRMPKEPDMETLTYWVTRLEPLIRQEGEDEIVVVFCNRTGTEEEAVYAGTSAVIGIQEGEVKVYGLLGRGEKELLVVDTDNPPYAKLVYRPEGSRDPDVADRHGELTDIEEPSTKPPSHDSESPSGGKGTDSAKSPDSAKPSPDSAKPPLDSAKPSLDSARPPLDSAKTPPDSKSLSAESSSSGASTMRKTGPRSPMIRIPAPVLGLAPRESSANSPGTDSFNIPTPTAPSPTPMAIRPKITIPNSNSSPAYPSWSQTSTPHPSSARSGASIKSNPRPPAESTPYPDSGCPTSGHPPNAHDAFGHGRGAIPEKRIYGGDVSIIQSQDLFSPVTPFEEFSPMSPRYFWRPSESLLKTPLEPQCWSPALPDCSPIISRDASGLSRSFPPYERSLNSTDPSLQDKGSVIEELSGSLPTRSGEQVPSDGSVEVGAGPAKDAGAHDNLPARPSSPKSRNASRSRGLEISESALSTRPETTAAITQHLEQISQRAESANRHRVGQSADRQGFRNSSAVRVRDEIEHHRDTGRANSVVYSGNGRQSSRPMSSGDNYTRSQSESPTDRADSRNGTRTPTTHSAVRGSSRGRQPGPQWSPNQLSPKSNATARASSREVGHGDGHRGRSKNRKETSNASAAAFESVEAIVSPSCPIHGNLSATVGNVTANTFAPLFNHSTGLSGLSLGREDTWEKHDDHDHARQSSTESCPHASDCSSSGETSETAETVESPNPSPHTPYFFNPKTPTAMVFVRETKEFREGPLPVPLPGGKAEDPLPSVVRNDVEDADQPASAIS